MSVVAFNIIMSSGRKQNKTDNFNQNDKERLNKIYKQLTEILDEIKSLRKEMLANKDKIEQLRIENLKLKQAANLNIFHTDNLEQYSRRENIRIYGIPESTTHNNRDDRETSLLKIGTALQIDLEPKDIQRVHSHGKIKYSPSDLEIRSDVNTHDK